MPRPDPTRLDPATYPFTVTIQTRFQDLDVLGHINNVAMAALFESGRVRFNQAIKLHGWAGHRWLVARVEINYLGEGFFPDDVEIASGIGEIGTRSWSILSAAFQNGACIATCDVVLVMSASGGLSALPDEFRAGLEANRLRL
ncbi:acyl-CoA thioesterase [Sphingomonas glacialis]|uniref:Acyl-CoA thioesterase n=1 Tax=Sphingomonas glacialis TaxID=658225 RepID=A0A502G5P5_9SPHN|nr:acyl-CoA thioesterase [Sphingomonas glacialis]TPG56223.1 acyl-CoA thioesterase [Sphingomonas glacialis]